MNGGVIIEAHELEKSVFNTLYDIDTREREVEKDTGKTTLNYLPWATTYSEVCKHFDDITYEFLRQHKHICEEEVEQIDETHTITKKAEYDVELPYFETPLGLEVRTTVTINGQTKEMCLPVYDVGYKGMDTKPYTYSTKNGQKEVKAARIDDVYKSIMRCFAKNLSMWGVGLHMWTKEDAPESVLQMNKLQSDCMELIAKKSALSEETKDKVAEICKAALPLENGDPRLCEDSDILEGLKKQLQTLRKVVKA